MASSTRRSDERTRFERGTEQQREATIRSIDETRENIRRAIEEARREAPRQLQTLTDVQNETVDATQEIADIFLETQKDVVKSMQSAWAPAAERMGYWMGWMQQPWGWNGFSPREMADMYARLVSSATENFVAGSRMATNILFAGMEATRTTTKYARQNAREMSKITSNTARAFSDTAREASRGEGEGSSSAGMSGGGSSSTTTAGTAATTGTTSEEGAAARGEAGSKRK